MDIQPETRFASHLLQAKTAQTLHCIASGWFEQTVTYRLQNAAAANITGLGGHLRRSFLGSLARGASSAAMNNQPCSWDPPCGLDIFLREQFRGARGDGLPKPYVIFSDIDGADLLVSLRVFGLANDWFNLAAEAMLDGMRQILPWQRLTGSAMAPVTDRGVVQLAGLHIPDPAEFMALEFTAPVDVAGKGGPVESSLLSRLLRRIDGLARWQGLALSADYAKLVSGQIKALDYNGSRWQRCSYVSPNRKGQKRRHKTVTGMLVVSGDLHDLLPLLVIGERCHIGRAAVEGLGRFCLLSGDGCNLL